MSGKLLILSADVVFARMLELEFLMQGMQTKVLEALTDETDADVILWDLDSVRLSSKEPTGVRMIGFTKLAEVSRLDPNRICSIILHRPFEMRMLRDEIALLLSVTETGEWHRRAHNRLRLKEQTLFLNEKSVLLSPTEAQILRLLMEEKGNAVSRERIAKLIGESLANKVDVYICYLRRKLTTLCDGNLIRTVRGIGYRLTE